ncbi:plasmid partitioning protein RepB [Thetidibacter halocola]|uniref:Plasmid partitioning protein RepB n=1 Tax=Thetidibacter halocola TaxID=2827239 RepID=A0A8J7WFN8_9RHOB|nr:plasmid partitioning protein RepB [Thetidibacter halocola]MBS0126817.1 plasmid partitioning protein RepB [Thetidibacter halocola]
MARKNLLKGLMEGDGTAKTETVSPENTPAPEARSPYKRGAIGAVSRSIADLKSRSVMDLDPFTIRDGGLADRLEHDEEDHARLMDSLKTYGQQVPVLVRPMPGAEGQYQIVYGRRRVLALRDLGLPVKAMIRDLDDDAAIMAQGQENAARRDLSFIEKVNFARQMTEAGYDRKTVCDALATDKTLISRMLSIAQTVPIEMIEMIGAAPGIGRDRWLSFARLWEEKGGRSGDTETARDMIAAACAETSDARFDALLAWLEKRGSGHSRPPAPRPRRDPQTVLRPDGAPLAEIRRSNRSVTITLPASDQFTDWLESNLTEIHRDWEKSRDGE